MIQIRRSEERGRAEHGWLDTHHTFSFADYYDPRYSGFHTLLVINEDKIRAGTGFGTHGHRDMEIITYILEGTLEHKDSLGTGSILRPGDVQRMSAGTGVRHSEFNHSKTEPLHLLQIWISPKFEGITPSYEEKHFSKESKKNQFRLIVSPEGSENSLKIHQNAFIYATVLDEGKTLTYSLKNGHKSWVQIARGSLDINGNILNVGDAAAIENEESLQMTAIKEAEALVFDLS